MSAKSVICVSRTEGITKPKIKMGKSRKKSEMRKVIRRKVRTTRKEKKYIIGENSEKRYGIVRRIYIVIKFDRKDGEREKERCKKSDWMKGESERGGVTDIDFVNGVQETGRGLKGTAVGEKMYLPGKFLLT